MDNLFVIFKISFLFKLFVTNITCEFISFIAFDVKSIDTTKLRPLLKSGVLILEDFKKDVVDSSLAEVILKRLDQVQIQLIKDANFSKNLGILDTFQDLSGHIKTEFKRNKQYSPTNDYLKYKFGPEELKCRKFGN